MRNSPIGPKNISTGTNLNAKARPYSRAVWALGEVVSQEAYTFQLGVRFPQCLLATFPGESTMRVIVESESGRECKVFSLLINGLLNQCGIPSQVSVEGKVPSSLHVIRRVAVKLGQNLENPVEVVPRVTEDVSLQNRLEFDDDVSDTSPVVKGTWITASDIVTMIVDGWSWQEILTNHPELCEDDIRACLTYAIEHEDCPDFLETHNRGSRQENLQHSRHREEGPSRETLGTVRRHVAQCTYPSCTCPSPCDEQEEFLRTTR